MNPMEFGKFEPPADARSLAQFAWGHFVALRSVGFTDEQAMTLLTTMITASAADGSRR